jgi:nitrite reductase/ring-hydroxylating ferredoxin subunit
MHADHNDLITRVGPGTACGALLRRYWHPVALLDEFSARQDARAAERPVKAVRLLGEDFVLFRDGEGRWGFVERHCPHRGADLSYGRLEPEGLRCPFHGWKFAADGRCLETPAEPAGSALCTRVRARAYPTCVLAGAVWAWLGPEGEAPTAFPAFDAFRAPASHAFAFKGLWHCNWLQAFEVGIDPAHPSFLHRYLEDPSMHDGAYGRQFRAPTAGEIDGERWPMTRIMREFTSPEIGFEAVADGLVRITALRPMTETLTHVRVTHAAFPATFVIPLSETITITQLHVPVDDTHTYWWSFFTSFAEPLDHDRMRAQRLACVTLPDYAPKSGAHDRWGFDPDEQRTRTYLGMGEDDINRHDQWAVESMGAIQDRTREHLGTSDKVIMANRRALLRAIETVRAGGTPPMVLSAGAAAAFTGPDTIDCVAPATGWEAHWAARVSAKRAGAAWLAEGTPAAPRGAAARATA